MTYTHVYRHFNTFVELAAIKQGSKITNDDIDFFLGKFLSNNYLFNYEGARIPCANTIDPETKTKAFDMTGKSYKEAHNELKPLLEAKVRETYGEVSYDANASSWDPKPRTTEEYAEYFAVGMNETKETWGKLNPEEKYAHPAMAKAQVEVLMIKSRIMQYFDKVLPFMLRKTMHHPIAVGSFSTTAGPIPIRRNDDKGNQVVLNTEDDLQNFVNTITYTGGFPGGKNESFRFMFWNPTISGKDVKVGIIDIDNPAGIPSKEVRKAVKAIANKVDSLGHPFIIMFTGGDYQIWIGERDQPLGDQRELTDYLYTNLFGLGAFERDQAIANNTVHIDPITFNKAQPTRMFFSLHYPTVESKKKFSGLAAIPITIKDLPNFEPLVHAHPEVVLENFDAYAAVVAAFFDTVQIGQDYESEGEIESLPENFRLQERFSDYEPLKYIHSNLGTISSTPEDVAKNTADEEIAYAYMKRRGVDAILKYDNKGGFRFNEVLKKEFIRAGKLATSEINCVSATRNGVVMYSNYMTRDLERFCEAKGIKEVTLVGQIVEISPLGVELDTEDVMAKIIRKEGLDPDDMKNLRFVTNYIASFNEESVPIEVMAEEVTKFNTNKIHPGPGLSVTSPVGNKLKKFYQGMRNSREGRDMVVMGEETYFITSKTKIAMVVMGVAKDTKIFKSGSSEIGPVFVGVVKSHRNKGPIYYILGKAEIALKKEDRIKLKEIVYGEDNKNRIPIAVRNDDFVEQIEIVEPSVVVDVVYDDVSNTMTNALPFHFLPSTRGKMYRGTEMNAYGTNLLGAKVTAIRTDLDPLKPADASYKQDDLITIQGTAPKMGFSILNTLPNPGRKATFALWYEKSLGELPDKGEPWKLTAKAYSKFNSLRRENAIGFVKKKTIIYEPANEITILGEDDEMFDASFTFRASNDFRLRGIDVVNATKMSAQYGIKWHAVITKNKFYWIYCDIENPDLRKKRDFLIETQEDNGVKSVLSDMMDVVMETYPLEKDVKYAQIPGFIIDILTIEKIERNPAFFGVDSQMSSFYETRIDTHFSEEPINKQTKYGYIPVHYFGGRKVTPHLFTGTENIPGEFQKAFERFEKGEEGYKVYVDPKSERKGKINYYRVTSLPHFMQTAVDDPRNYGQDGISIMSMNSTIDEPKSHRDAHNARLVRNKNQEKEDHKVTMMMLDQIPGDIQSSEPDIFGRGYDQNYVQAVKDGETTLKKVLSKKKFSHFDDARDSILGNPPVKQQAWQELIDEYIRAYADWEKELEPKELWEIYSQGLFPGWAAPLLEKERLLQAAVDEHELTEEEVRIVNTTFGTPLEADTFESILGDLYLDEDEDDDVEELE